MFKMNFEFERGEENSVEQLNAALASMHLSSVKIADSDGFLVTHTSYDKDERVTGITLDYGFDAVNLECEQEDGETLLSWQFDVAALPKGEVRNGDAYHNRWCAAHPDCVMRLMQVISFDTADAFIVLYHKRSA